MIMPKTDREKKIDELTKLLDERGYLTKEEDELYGKLIDEKVKEKSMSDEERLAFLKEQASSGFGQLAGDYMGFNMDGKRPKSKSIFEEIAELEKKIAKKNTTNQ